jgi:hypothetical protein
VSLIDFWNEVHETGHAVVDDDGVSEGLSSQELCDAIASTEREWRLELAFVPPPLVMPAAVWAVQLMYRAAQLLVYHEIDAAVVERDLSVTCPEASSPAVVYSVDLAMRLLPDLVTLARAVSDDDPLTIGLMRLARQWPLSSVGILGVGSDFHTDAFFDHPCLRRVYVDRIIDRRDTSRLSDARVAAVARESIGGFPTLVPELVKALETKEPH